MIHSASAYPRLQARVKRTIAYTPIDAGRASLETEPDDRGPGCNGKALHPKMEPLHGARSGSLTRIAAPKMWTDSTRARGSAGPIGAIHQLEEYDRHELGL